MIKDAYGNARFYGVYRGVVYKSDDPLNLYRLQLKVPQILADQPTDWAWPVEKPGVTTSIPKVGQGVWVMFEGGDPSYPIWTGTFGAQSAGVEVVASTIDTTVTPSVSTGSTGNYGAFQYTGSQTVTDVTVEYLFPWNTTDYSSGVYISNTNTSRIYFQNSGVYNIQWSGQFQNTNNVAKDIYVWLAINGTHVVGSTGIATIPGRHGSFDGHNIVGWNYFLTFTAGQYLEFNWGTESNTVSLQSYVAETSPARPATAALILTAQQVA